MDTGSISGLEGFYTAGFPVISCPVFPYRWSEGVSHRWKRSKKKERRGKAMPYEESRARQEAPHHIILEEREQLSVSGVEEVESFDEAAIVMYTSRGTLVVRGEGLHIEKLSLDGGDLKVEGEIDSLTYEEDRRTGAGGLLARLFR